MRAQPGGACPISARSMPGPVPEPEPAATRRHAAPALVATASATDACARIDARAAAFEASTGALVEASKQHLVRHVAMKTEELGRAAGEAQVQAMRDLFRDELGPLVERLAAECARRTAGSKGWHQHWVYATTAVGTSAIAALAAIYLLSR